MAGVTTELAPQRQRQEQRWRWWFYKWLGPSTKHLQLEWYLVICLELLTASSLKAMYKQDFMTNQQDFLFFLLHTLWLSKYWIFRVVCLWDNASTNGATPSIRAWISQFVTLHVTGGQTFDRPAPSILFSAQGTSSSSGTKQQSHHHTVPSIGGGSAAAGILGSSAGGIGIAGGSNASGGITGIAPLVVASKDEANLLALVPNSFTYPLQLWKVCVWVPILRFMDRYEHQRQQQEQEQQEDEQLEENSYSNIHRSDTLGIRNNTDNTGILSFFFPSGTVPFYSRWRGVGSNSGGGGGSTRSGRGMHHHHHHHNQQNFWYYCSTIYRKLVRYIGYLWMNGPSMQFLLPNVFSCIALYPLALRLRFYNTADYAALQSSTPSALYEAGFSSQMKAEDNRIKRQGNYMPHHPISIYELFAIVMAITLFFLCVSFFSRVMPPIPDQVAGNNVAKDAQIDAKLHKQNSANSGSGGGKGSHGGKKGSSTSSSSTSSMICSWFALPASSSEFSQHARVWTERHCPIVTENRMRVHRMVLLWRLLDIWICCGWLPRSDYLAQALGHTLPSSNQHLPHRLAHDLYPAGLTRPVRSDLKFLLWEKHIRDPVSFSWHVWNLLVLPVLMLAVQMLYLNRTYFSTSSYFAGEWNLLGPVQHGIGETMGPWDPRKKYKKDDIVLYNDFMYQAEVNHPEGRPVEPDIRDYFQDFLVNEIGHVGTSKIISMAYVVQLVSTLMQASCWVGAFFYTDRTPEGFMIAVAANFLASHALSTVGMNDFDELKQINNAILGRPTSHSSTPQTIQSTSTTSTSKDDE